MIQLHLESDRLLIRPFQLGDEQAMYEMNSDPIVQKYTGDKLITSVEEAKNLLINVVFKDYEKHGYGRLAVIYKPDNKLIGFTGFKYLPEADGKTDLGYRFIPEYWGKGIATESALMSLKYGFKDLGLKTIYAFTETENIGSVKIIQKLGFSLLKVAPYPGEEDLDDKEDVEWYSLTKEDYETSMLKSLPQNQKSNSEQHVTKKKNNTDT